MAESNYCVDEELQQLELAKNRGVLNLEKPTGKQFTRLASDTRLKFFSMQNGGKVINSKTKKLLEKSATD